MARMDRGFDEAMRKSLTNNRVNLVNNLTNVEGIMDHLVQGGVFSDPEMILFKVRRMDQVRKLLDDLPRRPARDYWTFLKCLYYDAIGQEHIAEDILKKYEEAGGTICDGDLMRMRHDYLQQQHRQGEERRHREHQQTQRQHVQLLHRPDMVTEQARLQQNATQPQQQQTTMQQLCGLIEHQPSSSWLLWLRSQQEQSRDRQPEDTSLTENHSTFQPWRSEAGNMVTCASGESLDMMAASMGRTDTDPDVHDGGDGPGTVAMDDTPAPIVASGLNNASTSTYDEQRARDSTSVYNMDSNPRGRGLIINNREFDHFTHRDGTDDDCEKLECLFREKLRFDVETRTDLTAEGMLTALRNFAENLTDVDACMVAILTHGGAGEILFGTDAEMDERIGGHSEPRRGTFITTGQLQNIFSGVHCPGMREKPKLFIFQACRGDLEDTPAGQRAYGRDILAVPPSDDSIRRSHEQADMVFLYATVGDYVAYRNVFIQILVDVFNQFAHNKHLLELQTIITRKMADRVIDNHIFTVSEGRTRLTKDWYLNPPLPSQ